MLFNEYIQKRLDNAKEESDNRAGIQSSWLAVLAESKEELLENMENTLSTKCNMSVNKIKSKIPIISKQDQRLGEKRLDNTNEFVYLCSKDSIHGRRKREVVSRIHQV